MSWMITKYPTAGIVVLVSELAKCSDRLCRLIAALLLVRGSDAADVSCIPGIIAVHRFLARTGWLHRSDDRLFWAVDAAVAPF